MHPSLNKAVSITQIWLWLLEFIQISMKFLYTTQIWNEAIWGYPKLNKAVWSYAKLIEAVPHGQSLNGDTVFPYAQSWFSLLEFTQIFPIYGDIFNFTQNWMKLF